MYRLSSKSLKKVKILNKRFYSAAKELPASADVVIIGGGSAGCNTLYQLARRGVNAILLERARLTSGTTWHTAGLVWRLRPSDVEIELLASTRNCLMGLEAETDQDPGWIQNGGLFISHSEERLNEYKRLATLGKCFGVESFVLDPKETQKIFPLLDPNSFTGALYSPGDGVVDPAMMCTALTKGAAKYGGRYFESCPVQKIVTKQCLHGGYEVTAVETAQGSIKTGCVINATGVWGRDLLTPHGIDLPLIPMKHAYVISESIPGVKGMPNIRDHDASVYFRIQGEAICMGGYENNPILLDKVAPDFEFGLYTLDFSTFEPHVDWAGKLCPAFAEAGIKSTVCGPESFTPDHKPIMGPDPRLHGLFHQCGFNSAGMMLGAGCAEQMAHWVIHGRPELDMFSYDIRRFTPAQTKNLDWATQRSHESYVKNYSIVFPNDQPLAGRNFTKDPLHDELMKYNAVMEERSGWERPGYFLPSSSEPTPVQPYDWYGAYEYAKNSNTKYEDQLKGEYKFGFSDTHDLIASEAMACRRAAAIFNLSYFCKLYLTGPQAQKAADYIFTANTNTQPNKVVYTCALNKRGGVEADVTVSSIESGNGHLTNPIFKDRGFYVVAGGASAYHTVQHIQSILIDKNYKATIKDVTHQIGVLSIQGPKSREILKKITESDLSDDKFPPNTTTLIKIKGIGDKTYQCRCLRVSFVGELGYELHLNNEDCVPVYQTLMVAGKSRKLQNAGYRALYSLSSEKGYHLWHYDLRSDDSPIEAGLGFTCRKNGEYLGKEAIDGQRKNGVYKKLAFFTLKKLMPIWGLEAVYRNGEIIGHLRRGEYGYTLQKAIGQAYVRRPDGQIIDEEFLKTGKYQIEVMGNMYDANCHLRSPFDPKGKRILGDYS